MRTCEVGWHPPGWLGLIPAAGQSGPGTGTSPCASPSPPAGPEHHTTNQNTPFDRQPIKAMYLSQVKYLTLIKILYHDQRKKIITVHYFNVITH
jgi:hypothetical protein